MMDKNVRKEIANKGIARSHIVILDEEGNLCGVATHRDLFRGALLKALGYGSFMADKMIQTLLLKE